jgi:hypothetical protein
MSGVRCKSLIDCNGELLEAVHNVPLLIVNHAIENDEAIDKFNEMKEGWAAQYREWKATYINFDVP